MWIAVEPKYEASCSIGMKPVKSSSPSRVHPLSPPKDKLLQVFENNDICDIASTGPQIKIKTSAFS